MYYVPHVFLNMYDTDQVQIYTVVCSDVDYPKMSTYIVDES
jgi:hypothetical protein